MKLHKIFRTTLVPGEVGIEVEVEGHNLPRDIRHWRTITDGSLRGEAFEYILPAPILRNQVHEYLQVFNTTMINESGEIRMGDRTSVHVHINVQELTVIEAFCFIVIYLVVEDLLFKYCGEGREGNLFCLRGQDAEYIVDILEHISVTSEYQLFGDDGLRYSGINLNAISKFGSLEFRGMRGTVDNGVIETWVNILLALKDAALTYADPQEIIADISEKGVRDFLEGLFSPEICAILTEFPDWEGDIVNGYRRVQRCAYSCNWEIHKSAATKPRYHSSKKKQPRRG